MHFSWCLQFDSDRPPLPYNELDVLVLVLLIFVTTWLGWLSLVAVVKWRSTRFNGFHIVSLLGMNIGAWVHIMAVAVSNGILVGVSQFDTLRNIHCSLWDFWAEFGIGFNVWFCSLAFLATKIGLAQFHGLLSNRHTLLAAIGVVAFFSVLVLSICLVAELGDYTAFHPELGICVARWPVKTLVMVYAGSCLLYAAIFSLLVQLNRDLAARKLVLPLRTVVVLGVAVLAFLMLANLANITVYPAGRLLTVLVLSILYLVANTTFYRDVLRDILLNHNQLAIGLEFELQVLEDPEDVGNAPALMRRDGFDHFVLDSLQRQPRQVLIPASAFGLERLEDLRAMINDYMTLSPTFIIGTAPGTDDEEDDELTDPATASYTTTEFTSNQMLDVVRVADLANFLALGNDAYLSEQETMDTLIRNHFHNLTTNPRTNTIPVTKDCLELMANPSTKHDREIIRDCIINVCKAIVRKYTLLTSDLSQGS